MKKNTRFSILFLFLLFSFLSNGYGQKVIKILAIGNSFSEDAAESYVDDLAKADGVQLVIGNLYIGGCSLETHWSNASTNSPSYSYRKIINGDTTRLANKSIQFALADDDWDYITFQQVSQYSGKYNTYFPYLTNLMEYVKGLATNPNVQYCMHRTWAYASNSTHSEYDYYQSNQRIMYDSIVDVTKRVAAKVGISIIIPAGTAIQNGRTSFVGDNFNRDGYHLTYGLGRYTAACTWYEKMLGKPVIGNAFVPAGVSKLQARVAQQAAHFAVIDPDRITTMDVIANPPIGLKKTVQIDFGTTNSALPWNNLGAFLLDSSIDGLLDIDENNTGVSIRVSDAFGGVNTQGPTVTTTPNNFPSTLTVDSFWGNGTGSFSGKSEPTAGFLISGLDAAKAYDFSFFASRSGATDNRETTFTVVGSNQKEASVDASNNTTNILSINEMKPNADGTISINLKAGANNNNQYKFFYINSMMISPSALSSAIQTTTMKSFRFYPNPVSRIANLETEQGLKNIQVYDLSGRKILAVGDLPSGSKQIDLGDLKDGCYLLTHQTGSLLFVKKQ